MSFAELCCNQICVVIATFSLLAVSLLHLINWFDVKIGLFARRMDEMWASSHLTIIDARSIFIMWIVVYEVQLIWLLFGIEFTACCRTTRPTRTTILPTLVYVLMTGALAATIGWVLLTTDTRYEHYSPLCMLAASLFLYANVGIAVGSLIQLENSGQNADRRGIVWANRFLVHNGIALFAAWSTLVMLYDVTVSLVKLYELKSADTSYIFFGFVLLYLCAWFAVDVLVGKLATLFIFTPYTVTTFSIVKVVIMYLTVKDRHFVIGIILLGLLGVLIIVKVVMAFIRMYRVKHPDNEHAGGNMVVSRL